MGKKPKAKAHIVVEGHEPGVYIDYEDVKKQTKGFSNKVHWGCTSVQEAEEQFQAICAWCCLSPENRTEKLTLEKAKEIVAEMLADSESYIKQLTPDNQQTEFSEVHEAVHIILTCELGTGGESSTIISSGGGEYIIQTTLGAKAPRKRLELGYEALKAAVEVIKHGADSVEIDGLDDSVERTLCHLAPNWKANGWLNSAGKTPANLDLIKSLLEVYEQIKDKVTLGPRQAEVPDTDDVPF